MNAIANDRQASVLEEYAKLKLQLAGTLRNLLHIVEHHKNEMAVGDCRRLLARLAEDRFNLAMVGQFSRGKSSLMNALLGAEKLPTGILPLTSVITTVAYGESERVLLQREGWTLPQEIRLNQLSEYVTQHGNPGNEKRVTLAKVQLPLEMLRLGVHFIDTPGVASALRANTRATRQFLPEIDAAILVTSFESPLTKTELDFLGEIREHVRTVFIVVNKHDLVPPEERLPVLEAMRDNLRTAFGGAEFDLFAVSARDALLAKQRGSAGNLEASGLPALEIALTSFLRARKARELLSRAADRTEGVARQQAISLRISERARAPEDAEVFHHRLQQILARINDERQALTERLRNRLELEFPRKCQQRIGLWNSDLYANLTSECRTWFLRDDDISGYAFQDFLRVQSQKIFSEWVSRNRQPLDDIFGELAQEENSPFEGLARKICGITAEVLAENVSDAALLARPIEARPLTLRDIAMPLEGFQLPWWYDLIPRGRPRELAYRHWQKRTPEFIQLYQQSVQAVLKAAMDDWVADMNRQLKTRMESAQSHIIKLLRDKADSPRSTDIQDILDRIQGFRETVERMGTAGEGTTLVTGAMTAQGRRSPADRCSICSRMERTLWEFMAHSQYELSVRKEHQRRHALRSGFCPLHTWQYEAISAPQDVCAAYPQVLNRFAERLRSLAEDSSSVESMDDSLRTILPSQSRCEACDLLASDERAAAEQYARKVSEHDAECPPLCAYHLHTVLASIPDVNAAKALVLDQARAFDDVAEEMQNYVLKHTAVRHHLTTRTESQAAMAGLSRLVGSQRLSGPWRID